MTMSTAGAHALDEGRVCLLVTGPPGAGKSTTTRHLAQALTRSALIPGDAVAGFVARGYVWPLGEPADQAAHQVALCNDNLCALAANFMTAGFTPVIDWVVPDGDQLAVYRRALGQRLRLIVLDPGTQTSVARDRDRPAQEQFAFDNYSGLRASMWEGFGGDGWWLDTSELTVDATIERMLHEADERAVLR